MGGTIEYVFWQGCRLTPWMLYVLLILDAQLWAQWGVRLILVSAIRTFEQQKAIFLKRYVRYADINGRRVYDTRVWQGVRYYRIDPTGTVAQPSTSNHEIRGDVAAVDIKDTGTDPGITAKNSERGRWLRHVFGPQYGMDPEGDSFAEGWHHRMRGIFRTPPTKPAGGASKPAAPTPKEIIMATEVIVTEKNNQGGKLSDRDRRVAFVNTESGFSCDMSWLTLADADKWAKQVGMPAGALRFSDAGFDKFIGRLS